MDPNAIQNIPSQLGQQGNPLDQLKDIHLPADISIWPIAWPWWALLVSAILIIAFSLWFHKKNKWKKAALNQLAKLQPDSDNFVSQVNRLLKQISLGPLQQTQSAQLSGLAWIEFLNTQSKQPLFIDELQYFAHAPDDPNIQLDKHALQQACETWIKQQTRPRKSAC